jgi:tetratricopeptide (TPR) repeat protein
MSEVPDRALDILEARTAEPIEQNTSLQLVLDFLLFLALFVTPWLISTELKEVFNTTKNCFLGLAAIAIVMVFVVETVGRGTIEVPRSPALVALALLAGWMTLSLAWGDSFSLAVRDWGYHVALFAIFGVTLASVTSRDRMENLLHFAIASGVIVAGYATMQYYGLDERVFRTLSEALWREDTSRIDPSTNLPVASGVLSWFFAPESARAVHSWIDPRFLILPSKPEEPSKNYSFMGHRNYLAGYLIALIPLVMSRLMAHTDVLVKEWSRTALYSKGVTDAIKIQALILVPVLIFGALFHPARALVLLLGGGLVLTLITQPLVRSTFVYLASMTLMFATVLQTHTRGSWIGLAIGIPFLVIMICWKEWLSGGSAGAAESLWRGITNRMGLFIVALAVKIQLVGQAWSWIPLIAWFGELLIHYALVAFRPRFLHRSVLLLSIVPLAVVFLAFNWKGMEAFGFRVKSPLNREWVSALDRLDDTFKFGVSTSTHQRWLIYKTTWWIIKDSPWNFLFGTGIGTFALHYMPYQSRVLAHPDNEKLINEVNKSIYAHNEYFHYWSELGLVGLALFVLTGVMFFWRVAKDLVACELNYDTLLYVGIVSSIMAVMGHILFSFCLHLSYTAIVFYCMAAFALRFFPGPVFRLSWNPSAAARAEYAGLKMTCGLALSHWSTVRAHVRALVPADKEERADLPPIHMTVTDPSGRSSDHKLAPPDPAHRITVDGRTVPVAQVVAEQEASPGTWRYRVACGGEALAEGAIRVGPTGLLPQIMTACLIAVAAYVPARAICDVLAAEYHWRNGFLKFRLQKFEESFLDYVKAIERDGRKGEILFDFGRALMDSGRNQVAVKLFLRATENFVDPANFHNIALCYFKDASAARARNDGAGYAKSIARAEWAYRESLRLNLVYEQSLSNLIFMLLEQALETPAKGKELLAEAELHAGRGVRMYRGNPTFWTALGVVLARQERSDDALLPLLRALDLMLIDRARRKAGELKTEEESQRTLQLDLSARAGTATTAASDPARLREVDSKIQSLVGERKTLDGALREAEATFNGSLVAHHHAQLSRTATGAQRKAGYDETRAAFLKVVELLDALPGMTLDANADKVRMNLATILHARRGEGALAMRILDNLTDKGDAAARARYYSLVVDHFNARIEHEPSNVAILKDYARRLSQWSYDTEASKVLYRLLEIDRTDRDGMFMLAECLYRQRYFDESIREYRRLLSILPKGDALAPRIEERVHLIGMERDRQAATPAPQAPAPAPAPSAAPLSAPSPAPSAAPLSAPSPAPSAAPMPAPSPGPSAAPTAAPPARAAPTAAPPARGR